MVFSSISFLIFFLPCLLVCYFIVPAKLRSVRNFILLFFSLIFYGWGGPSLLVLILASITVNYLCGLVCGARIKKGIRWFFVFLAVAAGIGMLGYYKYAGFMAEIVNSLGFMVPVPEIVLPIGISFYTFQGLSYVIDVYRGNAKPQKNPFKIALYIVLFPQLVAGPIVRYTTVEHEISNRKETLEDVSAGIVRFIFGLAKKMVIANTMGLVADQIFAVSTDKLSVILAWIGAVAYSAQIYFDFSAYSDMAIGLGRIFGFHFDENFNYPYISKSVTEFWRRWHISLSTWFRDYVYIPMGGSYCSTARQIFNMLVVWLLTGLWHGAAWTFIIWGLWFFVLLTGEKYIWKKPLQKAPGMIRYIYTMVAIIISWVLFRAPDITHGFDFVKAMFGGNGMLYQEQAVYFLAQYWPEFILAFFASFPIKTVLEKKLEKTSFGRSILVWWPKLAAAVLLVIVYSKLATGSFNPFIYFRF